MKFLVIQTAFIGDVVLATPIIEKLHRFYPNATIDMLVRKGNEGVLADHPFLRKVLLFDKSKKKYRNILNLIREIRNEKYDAVINAQRFFTSGLITAFSGGKETSGFNKNPLSFLFDHALPHEISNVKSKHEVERNLSLIQHFTDDSYQAPKIYPSILDEQSVDKSNSYVCMAPASVWFTKQWPANYWMQLIDLIPSHIHVYLLGAKSDIALCESIAAGVQRSNVHVAAGKFSMLQSAAWMKYAMMNYVNDSAPMHFASAVNAKVTAIYLSTVPAFGFGPLSDTSFIKETSTPLTCRPCGLHGHRSCPEGHFKCSVIDPELVSTSLNYQNRI